MANDTCENKYLLWSTQLSKRGLELTKQDCLNVKGKNIHQQLDNRKNCRNEKLRKASIKKAVREGNCNNTNDCEGRRSNMVDWLGKESEMEAEYELCIAAAAAGGQPVRKSLYIPFQTWREMVDIFFGGDNSFGPPNGFLITEKNKWDAYDKPSDHRYQATNELCESFDETKPYSEESAVAKQDAFCFSYEQFRIANLNKKGEELHYYIIQNGVNSYKIQEKASYDTMMEGKQIKSYTVFIRDGYESVPDDAGSSSRKGGDKRKSRKRTRRRRRRKKYSKKSNRKLKKKSRKRKRKKRTRRRRRKR